MKKKTLLHVVICMFTIALITGCNSDTTSIMENEEFGIEESDTKSRSEPITMNVWITYRNDITEAQKENARNYYTRIGVLVNIEDCTIRNNETWVVNTFTMFRPDRDIASDTIEIERAILNAVCGDAREGI